MTAAPSRTVLIVEDGAADRAALRRMLREAAPRFTVLEARTGEEGLARVAADAPDCVLLDVSLPDMSGMELLAALAGADGRALRIPTVVITGQEDPAAAATALRRGAQDYIVKGTLTGHGLVRTIENAFEKFHIRRELEDKRAALELRNWQLEALRAELQAKVLELADATRAKDQFMAVMSHEMRTPLNAILGYAELLELGIHGPLSEGQRMQLERIRVGGRHLLDLINDVLDLARSDARKLELDLRPVDLVAVLEEVVALLESQAAAQGIALRLEPLPPALPLVRADLQRLRQVLTNVVGNAIKFTERGSVTLRAAARDDGKVVVEVEDTGIGIAPDVLPRIFDEFYQVDNKLTRAHGGSGLGLAIAQRLARLMGGGIDARSEVGGGSTFTIVLQAVPAGDLPRPEDVASHQAALEARRAARAERDGAREPVGAGDGAGAGGGAGEGVVTVVAFGVNEAALAELGRRVRDTVRLVWTTRPEEVASCVRREHPSLVLLDASGGDGAAWRAAAALQEEPELARAAVLLVPGIPAAEEEEIPGALDLGWVALVPKPFTAEQLAGAVSSAARHRGADGRGDEGEEVRDRDVLIVDDDEDSRRVAARFLAQAHARVREAADGESALVAMRRQSPDVVVLDLMMPVLDGFGVLAAMRADPALAGIPVVVLSAKTLTPAERDFLARAAARVLQKGEHRLADVAALVLRAAARAARRDGSRVES